MAKIQTDKQRKLVRLLSENLGLAKPKTMLEMMIEAGYSDETARQQSSVLAGIRVPIVNEMQRHPDEVIKRMRMQISKAKYRDLTDAIDKLTKNIQLLRGEATERPNNVITGLEHLTDDQLDSFIAGRKAAVSPRTPGTGALRRMTRASRPTARSTS
jgi:phage terminase small subunit